MIVLVTVLITLYVTTAITLALRVWLYVVEPPKLAGLGEVMVGIMFAGLIGIFWPVAAVAALWNETGKN